MPFMAPTPSLRNSPNTRVTLPPEARLLVYFSTTRILKICVRLLPESTRERGLPVFLLKFNALNDAAERGVRRSDPKEQWDGVV
ncbi:hypothetical protein E2C01_056269 [Portunus trituberculatus]|uniref:Uncharacterized protein n=1 Tax=Portunus trituberculatus TaxID=210409 RepID=A0A5B7GX82_PORTR|nr:hypothetical protein [Portunus trituberculatus]